MQKELVLDFEDYKDKGLYLIFPDSTKLTLTRAAIERSVDLFWKDPNKIPSSIKEAAGFQKCDFCPLKDQPDMCHALRPTMPFLDIVDKYVSYSEVIAVFKREADMVHVAQTTMQDALKFVSILSLVYYCETGKKYWTYFYGINPLMDAQEIATRFYLNVFMLHDGDRQSIDRLLTAFRDEITLASQNQAVRLNMVCKNDAFGNAFANTQVTSLILSMNMEEALKASFAEFEKRRQPQIPSY